MKKLLLAASALAVLGASNPARALGARPTIAMEFDAYNTQNGVFYLGPNANLYELIFAGTGWRWAEATGPSGGPALAAGSGMDAHYNGVYSRQEAFYLTNTASGVHVEELYDTSFSPTDLTVIAGGRPAAAGSMVSGFTDAVAGSDNLFYLGADQGIHVLSWMPYPGWSEDATLDGAGATLAEAGSPISGHVTANSQEIFYLGSNRHVYEIWRWSQNFDGWHPIDVTTANGGKPAAVARSPLAGFYDPASANDAMFYIGANQHVYELLFTPEAVWTSVDVTAGSSAPPVASGSKITAHLNTVSGSEEVFFLDAAQAVHILWSWSSPQKFDGWHSYSVSGAAGGAPAAAPGSPLSADMNAIDNTDDVTYVAPDKHVQELRYDEGTGAWTVQDLNLLTSPPAPKAVP